MGRPLNLWQSQCGQATQGWHLDPVRHTELRTSPPHPDLLNQNMNSDKNPQVIYIHTTIWEAPRLATAT